jgi:hypothetical protein
MSPFAAYFHADRLLYSPFRYFSLSSGYLFEGLIQPTIGKFQ